MDQTDIEIICLVSLYRALTQRNTFLYYEISHESIRLNYYKLNSSWKRYVDLMPRIRQIKLSFVKIHQLLTKKNRTSKKRYIPNETFANIVKRYEEISNFLKQDCLDPMDSEKKEHDLKFLYCSLTEKRKKQEQLALTYQENLKKLETLSSKSIQLSHLRSELSTLTHSLSTFKSSIKVLSTKHFQKSTSYLNDLKAPEIFSHLSPNHLLLKSKWSLKSDLVKILKSGQEAYERYFHFLNKEKRKLQKLSSLVKNEPDTSKLCNDITGSRTLSCNTNPEIFQSFRSISPIKPYSDDASSEMSAFRIETIGEEFDVDELQSINDSVQEEEFGAKEKLDRIYAKVKAVFT